MNKEDLKYIVGAYATAPSLGVGDQKLEVQYYEQIQLLNDLKGLEIPFWGEEIHRFGSEFLLNIIQPCWDNVLTCIPGTVVGGLAKNAKFGIASDDEQGRKDAIAMHKRANQILHRMNDRYGRQSIIAVQLATGPSVPAKGVSASKESLLCSMEEILSWDWDDAKIVIEHCDSSVEGQPIAKGFMALDQEIKVLQSLANDYDVGILVNWARSAIEGRNIDKPVEHLKMTVDHNMLSGLIFSGVSSTDDQYGLWSDTHMPFAASFDVKHFERNSLLTEEALRSSLAIVDLTKLDYIGVKLLSMPLDSQDIERRVSLNEDAIFILNQIIK